MRGWIGRCGALAAIILLGSACFPKLAPETEDDTSGEDVSVASDLAESDSGDVDAVDVRPDQDTAVAACEEAADCGLAAPCEGAWDCLAGQCKRKAATVCAGDGSCLVGVCAPSVPRADALGCITEPAAAETPCDDEDLCTLDEACGAGPDAGRCVPRDRVVCDAASDCRSVGVCDPSSGHCVATTETDGALCMDATWPDGREGLQGTCRDGGCLALPKV